MNDMKQTQINEAQANVAALNVRHGTVALGRYNYYQMLLGAPLRWRPRRTHDRAVAIPNRPPAWRSAIQRQR